MIKHIVIEHLVIQHSFKEFLSASLAAASWLAKTDLKTQWHACFGMLTEFLTAAGTSESILQLPAKAAVGTHQMCCVQR